MASLNKFNVFVQDLAQKVHDLATDTLYVMLTDTAPVATNTVESNITEIAAGNGYTAGGLPITTTSCTQTSGTLKLVLANPASWTATGGAIAQFRYAVIYNNTPTSKPLVGWADFGTELNLTTGEVFSVQFDQTNGALTLV
jgi:hypothetical protein